VENLTLGVGLLEYSSYTPSLGLTLLLVLGLPLLPSFTSNVFDLPLESRAFGCEGPGENGGGG